MSVIKPTIKNISKFPEWQGVIHGTRSSSFRASYFKPLAQVVIYLPPFVWVILDIICGSGAFLLAHWASPVLHYAGQVSYRPVLTSVIFGSIIALIDHILDSDDFTHLNSAVRIIGTALISSFVAIALVTLGLNWTLFEHIGRYIVGYSFIFAAVFITLTRLATRTWVSRARHRVAYIGSPSNFEELKNQLEGQFNYFFTSPVLIQVNRTLTPSHFYQELEATLALMKPDEIVVEDHSPAEAMVMEHCLEISKAGCLIRPLSFFMAEINREENLDVLTPRQLLMTPGLGSGAFTGVFSKRMLDLSFSLIGLIFSLPIGLIVAALIKIFMPGPVFYRQKRVGRYGKTFEIIKFRSMVVDAEKNGAVWAEKNDSRVTGLGRFLRNSRLDEIPQFWNILKGEMSFVGPRPERPEFVEKLEKELPYYHLRHLVKPGLTGWAQIKYHYGANPEEAKKKLAYDLYYVKHFNPLLDVSIFLRTLVTIAKGAR